ncbi:histone-lysine N-methyltransferase ASH1L [Talaromyces islandicus]|uniref:Histone-lysine N-methyltransferase ASH1L n=1 Tax=Talaromyces islandicus TaxID=28573 RepID=A0A0U1LIW8_TALIS|nr:histone-lysine N-methyltransferase ASH1L [Talaromyces islandicus]
MFGSIVDILSPAALIKRSSRKVASPASKMTRRTTRSSLESAAQVVPDAASPSEHDDNAPIRAEEAIIGVDFSGPLLTPEASRSETSSNNELAAADEKPVSRRRSTRVTRASLPGMGKLRETAEDNEADDSEASIEPKNRTVSGETLVNSLLGSRASRSSLRHGAPIAENSWSQSTLLREGAAADNDETARPDTPESKEGKELKESPEPSRRRSLRARPAKDSEAEQRDEPTQEKNEKATESPSKAGKSAPPRRSSRLSLVTKATEVLDRAASVLGKRSRDAMEKTVLKRRASLRPRHSLPAKSDLNSSNMTQAPDSKRRRLSDSDILVKKDKPEEGAGKAAPGPIRYKPKRWLDKGLYTGQHRDYDPRLNEANNKIKFSKRTAPVKPQRKLLPLPMFAGERLLKNGRDFKLPFDVFSPLPPGQPKPDEWKKVNRNVFVGDAASFWRENKKIELSTCLCDDETGCDENCQNRFMFYECDNSNCRVGPNCGNRSFDELKQRTKAGGKYNIGVEVIKTADRGYGVRSNRTFESNQVIVEYTGEIITQTECERRMRTVYKNNECYYLMYFDQNMIIDATRGSIARFVNHSCEPNCRMEKWTVGGKPRMALFAGDRGIMTGEELTYDYNFDPFSQKNVQECRCGAPTCRGVLGPKPKDRPTKSDDKKPVKKSSKATLSGTKRKLGNIIDESTSALNKKRKVVATKSVKKTITKAVTKAKALGTKKRPMQVKKNITVTKATSRGGKISTAKAKSPAKKISKSRVTKVATAAAKSSPKAKAKTQPKKAASRSSSGQEATKAKSMSASEKIKTKLKATARRSTSFKKGTQTLKLKSPAVKNGKKTPSKATPVKTPSRPGSTRIRQPSGRALMS